MSRMRSLSFPRSKPPSHQSSSSTTDDTMDSLAQFSPAPSCDSSATSTASSPTFSARGHNRWPSSASSLTTNPDSPPAAAPSSKTTLHDLVEDPAERDEISPDEFPGIFSEEPLCICDTPFCEHRQFQALQSTPLTPTEWTSGDDCFSDGQLPGEPFSKRRKSAQASADLFASRLGRRFPSISRRLSGHRHLASEGSVHLHSAPSSRASSSTRLPGARSIAASESHNTAATAPSVSPVLSDSDERSISHSEARPRMSRAITRPLDIEVPSLEEDPIDREQLASTPLLPPLMAEYFSDSAEVLQSPLQSPTIAAPSAAVSIANTPSGTPVLHSFPTPPLSAKPSLTSLGNTKPGAAQLSTSPEIPPLTIAEETDPWAIKLGHANFHIEPEPYMPTICDAQRCKRLADDWEAARLAYMRQASRISEHYGITSHTYKLTNEKWAGIDAVWRENYELANAEAQACGESPVFQPLAETSAPVSQTPWLMTLHDPDQPAKFPAVEEKDIVGPMVRYRQIRHEHKPSTTSTVITTSTTSTSASTSSSSHSKKPSLLKLFTDPASLLRNRA